MASILSICTLTVSYTYIIHTQDIVYKRVAHVYAWKCCTHVNTQMCCTRAYTSTCLHIYTKHVLVNLHTPSCFTHDSVVNTCTHQHVFYTCVHSNTCCTHSYCKRTHKNVFDDYLTNHSTTNKFKQMNLLVTICKNFFLRVTCIYTYVYLSMYI